MVVETSESHLAFRLQVGGVPRLFVKVADPVRSRGRDLTTEAAVYRLARSSPPLADVVPRCHAIAADDSSVVLEAVPGTPLSDTPLALGGSASDAHGRNEEWVLHSYGRAVARTHAVKPAPFGEPPWLLVSLEPWWGDYGWLPESCRHLLLRLAETPVARDGFRRSASAWRAEGLVHGDLRWANVLADRDVVPPRIWLIDWELACVGDPAWDLASVLADLLTAAALGGRGGARVPDVARPAGAFLRGYRTESRASGGDWPVLIERSIAMIGIRIVQTLLEYGSVSADHLATMEPVLLPWALECLAGRTTMARQLAQIGRT